MNERRALHLSSDGTALVMHESSAPSEDMIHRTIAAHPEVIPHNYLGTGLLVTIGNEVEVGTGSIDLLLADGAGKIVICQRMRGSEYTDVHRAVAQLLQHGAALWRLPYEELDSALRAGRTNIEGSLANHISEALVRQGCEANPDAIELKLRRTLGLGLFRFLYMCRGVDDGTRLLMSYLSEVVGLDVFAVEVDHFSSQDGMLLVLTASHVPTRWESAQHAMASQIDGVDAACRRDDVPNTGLPVAFDVAILGPGECKSEDAGDGTPALKLLPAPLVGPPYEPPVPRMPGGHPQYCQACGEVHFLTQDEYDVLIDADEIRGFILEGEVDASFGLRSRLLDRSIDDLDSY